MHWCAVGVIGMSLRPILDISFVFMVSDPVIVCGFGVIGAAPKERQKRRSWEHTHQMFLHFGMFGIVDCR